MITSVNYLTLTESALENHKLENPKDSLTKRVTDYLDRNPFFNKEDPLILERSYLQFEPSEKTDIALEQRGDALRCAVLSNNVKRVEHFSTLEHTEVKYREALRSAVIEQNLGLVKILLSNRRISDKTRGASFLDSLLGKSTKIMEHLLNSGEIPEEDLTEATRIAIAKDINEILPLLNTRNNHEYPIPFIGKILVFYAQTKPMMMGLLLEGTILKADLGKALCALLQREDDLSQYMDLIVKILEGDPAEEHLGEALCLAAKRECKDILHLLCEKKVPAHCLEKALYNAVFYKSASAYHEISTLFRQSRDEEKLHEITIKALTELAKKNEYCDFLTDVITKEDKADLAAVAASNAVALPGPHGVTFTQLNGNEKTALHYLEGQSKAVHLNVATKALVNGYTPTQIFTLCSNLSAQEKRAANNNQAQISSLLIGNKNITENMRIKAYIQNLSRKHTLFMDLLDKEDINELRKNYEDLVTTGRIPVAQVENLLFYFASKHTMNDKTSKMVELLLKISPPSDIELGVLLQVATSARNYNFFNLLMKVRDQILPEDIRASFFSALLNEEVPMMEALYKSQKISPEDILEAKAITVGHPNSSLTQFLDLDL